MKISPLGLLVLALSANAWAGLEDLGPATCGPLANAYGPFDYRTASQEQHGLVEGAHFTFPVESLQHGKNAQTPGPDIAYTLRVFPNHHRALLAVSNLSFKEKRAQPIGMPYSVECWMERGERWRPDDGVVKMLFGIYLLRAGRRDEALVKLEEAEKLVESDPNVYYNLGLAYFKMGRFEKALNYAHKAYALKYPLPGLRDMLKKSGHWQDARPAPLAQSSAPVSDTAVLP